MNKKNNFKTNTTSSSRTPKIDVDFECVERWNGGNRKIHMHIILKAKRRQPFLGCFSIIYEFLFLAHLQLSTKQNSSSLHYFFKRPEANEPNNNNNNNWLVQNKHEQRKIIKLYE